MKLVIEYDPAKDKVNRQKHGLSLADADKMDWETIKIFENHHHGEVRNIGYGYVGKRLYAVVFAYRGLHVRIISFRKANKRERRKYEA